MASSHLRAFTSWSATLHTTADTDSSPLALCNPHFQQGILISTTMCGSTSQTRYDGDYTHWCQKLHSNHHIPVPDSGFQWHPFGWQHSLQIILQLPWTGTPIAKCQSPVSTLHDIASQLEGKIAVYDLKQVMIICCYGCWCMCDLPIPFYCTTLPPASFLWYQSCNLSHLCDTINSGYQAHFAIRGILFIRCTASFIKRMCIK